MLNRPQIIPQTRMASTTPSITLRKYHRDPEDDRSLHTSTREVGGDSYKEKRFSVFKRSVVRLT